MRSIRNMMIALALVSGSIAFAGQPVPDGSGAAALLQDVTQVKLDEQIAAELAPQLAAQTNDTIHLSGSIRMVKSDGPAFSGSAGPSLQPDSTQPATTQPAQDFVLSLIVPSNVRSERLYNALAANRPIRVEDDLLVGARLALDRAAENNADEAYMGVGVDAPDATLRSQLSLPSGAGLVVSYVDDQGPANSALQEHDVLQKLDDQLLINAEQLVALVRMRKPGDGVSVTLLRQAKSITVQMALGRRTVASGTTDETVGKTPKYRTIDDSGRSTNGAGANKSSSKADWGRIFLARDPVQLDKYRSLTANRPELGEALWTPKLETHAVTFTDGDFVVVFAPNGNLKALNAKDGQVLYQGPVQTQQQWDTIPDSVRQRLATWRDVIHPADPTTQPGAMGR
jgi:PDZ domain-containing protein